MSSTVAGPAEGRAAAPPSKGMPPRQPASSQMLSFTGESFAQLATAGGGSGSIGDLLKKAREQENRHEIIALMGRSMVLNYSNFNKLKASAAKQASPTLVISLLGDTEVGKSTTIRELMAEEEERPFVQRGRQVSSTTHNVNLYTSHSFNSGEDDVLDTTVHFLDFEGENGSANPVMSSSTGSLSGGSGSGGSSGSGSGSINLAGGSGSGSSSSAIGPAGGSSGSAAGAAAFTPVSLAVEILPKSLNLGSILQSESSPLARAEAVRECFPKLAYAVSDIIVLIGIEPLHST